MSSQNSLVNRQLFLLVESALQPFDFLRPETDPEKSDNVLPAQELLQS